MSARALFFAVLLGACNATTGSGLVSFIAVAGGPADAAPQLTFDTGSGFHVTLSRAKLHVAAVYLNQSVPTSGAQESSCVLPGIYVAQAFGPLDLDLPSPGEGTATAAATAEVWLAGNAIDDVDDRTVILDVAGAAQKGSTVWPFTGSVTIGTNRGIPVQNPATPGSNPICHQRIVTPIAVQLVPTEGGQLTMRIDPRGMWNAVDFSLLTAADESSSAPPIYKIPDENGGIGGALYKGLVSNAGVYTFAFSAGTGEQK